ncbi:MAG: flagellar hook-length control protein FliK, partial [Candidatus Latescibacteria bacterium]|nr:flagellar hook-length control protein FliK [Candidatus Latescibacterota bacterium]
MFMEFKNPGLEFSTQSLLSAGKTDGKGKGDDFAALLSGMIGENESVSLMVPVSSETSGEESVVHTMGPMEIGITKVSQDTQKYENVQSSDIPAYLIIENENSETVSVPVTVAVAGKSEDTALTGQTPNDSDSFIVISVDAGYIGIIQSAAKSLEAYHPDITDVQPVEYSIHDLPKIAPVDEVVTDPEQVQNSLASGSVISKGSEETGYIASEKMIIDSLPNAQMKPSNVAGENESESQVVLSPGKLGVQGDVSDSQKTGSFEIQIKPESDYVSANPPEGIPVRIGSNDKDFSIPVIEEGKGNYSVSEEIFPTAEASSEIKQGKLDEQNAPNLTFSKQPASDRKSNESSSIKPIVLYRTSSDNGHIRIVPDGTVSDDSQIARLLNMAASGSETVDIVFTIVPESQEGDGFVPGMGDETVDNHIPSNLQAQNVEKPEQSGMVQTNSTENDTPLSNEMHTQEIKQIETNTIPESVSGKKLSSSHIQVQKAHVVSPPEYVQESENINTLISRVNQVHIREDVTVTQIPVGANTEFPIPENIDTGSFVPISSETGGDGEVQNTTNLTHNNFNSHVKPSTGNEFSSHTVNHIVHEHSELGDSTQAKLNTDSIITPINDNRLDSSDSSSVIDQPVRGLEADTVDSKEDKPVTVQTVNKSDAVDSKEDKPVTVQTVNKGDAVDSKGDKSVTVQTVNKSDNVPVAEDVKTTSENSFTGKPLPDSNTDLLPRQSGRVVNVVNDIENQAAGSRKTVANDTVGIGSISDKTLAEPGVNDTAYKSDRTEQPPVNRMIMSEKTVAPGNEHVNKAEAESSGNVIESDKTQNANRTNIPNENKHDINYRVVQTDDADVPDFGRRVIDTAGRKIESALDTSVYHEQISVNTDQDTSGKIQNVTGGQSLRTGETDIVENNVKNITVKNLPNLSNQPETAPHQSVQGTRDGIFEVSETTSVGSSHLTQEQSAENGSHMQQQSGYEPPGFSERSGEIDSAGELNRTSPDFTTSKLSRPASGEDVKTRENTMNEVFEVHNVKSDKTSEHSINRPDNIHHESDITENTVSANIANGYGSISGEQPEPDILNAVHLADEKKLGIEMFSGDSQIDMPLKIDEAMAGVQNTSERSEASIFEAGTINKHSVKTMDLPDETLNTIVRHAKIMQSRGQASAVIDLNPPNLGRLKLEIVTEQSMVIGKITVENHEVKEMIECRLSEL